MTHNVLQNAVDTLEHYEAWRDDETGNIPQPKGRDVSKALRIILDFVKTVLPQDTDNDK